VINTDKNPAYGEAIAELKQEGAIPAELEHREAKPNFRAGFRFKYLSRLRKKPFGGPVCRHVFICFLLYMRLVE
jgi:transposase-like protein